ncbi:hypothetical protein HYT00_02090 [Candidatus Giovannonibacteria bacterium]|nr:hypothetical protein [Candidatus Giovannonibacteria bacterium]
MSYPREAKLLMQVRHNHGSWKKDSTVVIKYEVSGGFPYYAVLKERQGETALLGAHEFVFVDEAKCGEAPSTYVAMQSSLACATCPFALQKCS